MDLTSNRVPNKALRGDELKEIAVKEFRAMLDRDHMFNRGIAYRRVAFTLTGTFHFGYPFIQPHEVKSRVAKSPQEPDAVVEGEFPLENAPEESGVVGLERDVTLDNPNVARISHGLPITIQEKLPPQQIVTGSAIPGEMPAAVTNPYPEFKIHELRYDATQFPKGPEPVDRDVSEQAAAKVKGGKPRGK